MSEEMSFSKTMLEVSKELGVSKDVVKYHQRKMNGDDSFKAFMIGKYKMSWNN